MRDLCVCVCVCVCMHVSLCLSLSISLHRHTPSPHRPDSQPPPRAALVFASSSSVYGAQAELPLNPRSV